MILEIFKLELERISKLDKLADAANVYSLLKGHGKIAWMRDTTLALRARFANGVTAFFTPSGKLDNNDAIPTTFSEPVVIAPAAQLFQILSSHDSGEVNLLIKQLEELLNGTKSDR